MSFDGQVALLVTVSALALTFGQASAATVNLTFDGTVTEVRRFPGVVSPPSDVVVGQAVSGSFTYDTEQVSTEVLTGTDSDNDAIHEFSPVDDGSSRELVIGSNTYNSVGNMSDYFSLRVEDNQFLGAGRTGDTLSFTTSEAGSPIALPSDFVSFQIQSSTTDGSDPSLVTSANVPSSNADLDTSQITSASGSLSHFDGGGNYLVFYDIDPSTISIGELVMDPGPDPEHTPSATIFLAFGSQVPVDVSYHERILTGTGGFSASNPGTYPAANIGEPEADQIATKVQEIFDDAGVNVEVVQSLEDATTSSVTTVYFGEVVPIVVDGSGVDRGILGSAFDVTHNGTLDPDQFNSRDDARVAVFGGPNDTLVFQNGAVVLDVDSVAKTVAHEVGHGYGLAHIDTIPSTVMATGFEGLSFSQLVEENDQGFSQNSTYHLRRWVGQEEPGDISLANGTWDEIAAEYQSASIDFRGVLGAANSWYLGLFNDGTLLPLEGGEEQFGLVNITDEIIDGFYSFEILVGSEWSVFGSTGSSSIVDIYSAFSGSMPDGDLLSGISNGSTLSLFSYSSSPNEFQALGDVFVAMDDVESTVVPLPSSGPLAIAGILSLMALRRRGFVIKGLR